MRLRNDVVEAPIRRRVDVVAWCFVTIGVIALIAPLVRIAVFDRTAGFDLLILAIPIAVGIRAGRDGWRIAALGAAFLCVCVSVMRILLLAGNGGYVPPRPFTGRGVGCTGGVGNGDRGRRMGRVASDPSPGAAAVRQRLITIRSLRAGARHHDVRDET
jgi:hypothetical protein